MEQNRIIASIILPMKNERSRIGRCLDSILANDFPGDKYEILVVDGNSTDGSRDAVASRIGRLPEVLLLDNPAGTVPTAMNVGICQARGAYIIRMDAHSEYPSNYIRTCIEELQRTKAECVGGCFVTLPGANTLTAEAIALITQHPVGVGNAAYRLGQSDRFVDTVPYGAFRRELFDRIGNYREDLLRNQDYELNARIRESGGKIFLSSKISIFYYNVPTFAKFMSQAYNNGTYVAQMWLRNPASFCWRHGAPLLFVAGLLGGLFVGAFSTTVRAIVLSLFAVYLLVILLVSVQISFRRGAKYLLVLPGLFFSCHLVYGVGTLLGLTRYTFMQRARSRVRRRSASASPTR